MFHTYNGMNRCGFQTYNGMNLSRSIHNPNSNFRRITDYLSNVGEATKVDIFRDVFGKVGKNRGWNCNVFSLAVKYGFIKMVRRGNRVFYHNA
jgi:hypothetical protein